MQKQMKKAALYLALLTPVAVAQTTVTTTGGTTDTVPLFTGTSTVGNSIITQSGGNIGIGATAPKSKFDILTSGYGLSIHGDDIGFNREVTTGAIFNSSGYAYQFDHIYSTTASSDYLALQVNTPSGASVTPAAWSVTGAGNVGIGTTTPSYPLTVIGDIVTGTGAQSGVVGILPGGAGTWFWMDNPNSGYLRFSNGNYPGGSGTASSVVITNLGQVGIGTPAPGAGLEVNGSIKLTSGSGGSITFADGTVQTTASTGVGGTCGGDYAESVDVSGSRNSYEPGDVLVIDPGAPGRFLKANEAYSTMVAGIYSTKPGIVGRRQTTDPKTSTTEIPMAMVGIVPTKVSAENGPIKTGDLLVASTTLGRAMKGTDRSLLTGAVIGKALASLDSGTGVIEVLVTLQ